MLLTGGSGGGSDCMGCSADLHDVLDCNGNVIETCPADQGCAPGGVCVPACDAAKANESTIGCDFYSVVPGTNFNTIGPCFAVMLANTWTSPIDISVEHAGQPLDLASMARVPTGSGAALSYDPLPNGQLGPGQLGLLFLSADPGGGYLISCPPGVTPGIVTDPALPGTGIASAFHIATSAPVVMVDIFPYGGQTSYITSATLLVPTSAWGTNYIANMPWEVDPDWAGINEFPHVQIVASEDGTQVTLAPTSAIVGGGGVAPAAQGQPVTYTLDRGQVLQLMQPADLSGSPIASDKPIGVWAGASNVHIPLTAEAGDSAHQQLVPVKALGHEYVGVRYRDRVAGTNESIPYTLVGAVDGTALSYGPAAPQGAPAALAKGEKVSFRAAEPVIVRSQDADHPFYFAAHMTGCTEYPAPGGECPGDPDYVNLVPPDQWLASYLFLTDPTYGNTHLVFVRKKPIDGDFQDVGLDCLGPVSGWQPVGASGEYQFAWVDLVKDATPVGSCDSGVHAATSTVPFGLTVWGWDHAVSYGYPAGMSVQPINTVVVPPIPE
jgi:hypothetical protein